MSNLEKIDLYLGGDMSLDEVQAFEQEMKSNPELHQEVQLQNAINHHLGEQSFSIDIKSDYKKKLDEIILNEDSRKIKETISKVNKEYNLKNTENKNPRLLYFLYTAAAVFVLIFGSYFLLQERSSASELYQMYYSDNDLPSFVQRSGPDGEKVLLERVTTLFNEKKYEEVLSNLNSLHQENSDNSLTRIYSALSYMNIGNQENALQELDILEKSNSLDAHKAYWFKSLVFLKFDDKKNAKLFLNKIADSSTNYKYAEAKKILEKL